VFVDFEGAMTASTVWINGVALGEYKGGYTPVLVELTPHLHADGRRTCFCVQVDPPNGRIFLLFGYEIDYMTFGGILPRGFPSHRPSTYIDNVFARVPAMF